MALKYEFNEAIKLLRSLEDWNGIYKHWSLVSHPPSPGTQMEKCDVHELEMVIKTTGDISPDLISDQVLLNLFTSLFILATKMMPMVSQ